MLVIVAAAVSLVGCTASRSAPRDPTPSTRTVTGTRTLTQPPSGASFTPAPAATVAPLPGGGKAPKGEKFAHCPYIRAGLNEDRSGSGANIADIEGDRVGRTTVLTGYRPVGCRFYFAYSYGNTRHEAVADILPTTFPTAAAAHNALVRTAQAGRPGSQQSAPRFAPGADGVSYQTKFFGPDGNRDWAFAFAKGTVLVVVHTQQNDSEINARNIGTAIAGKF